MRLEDTIEKSMNYKWLELLKAAGFCIGIGNSVEGSVKFITKTYRKIY